MEGFEFVVVGEPRSAQTRSDKARNEWKRRVGEAARARWPANRPPLEAEVSVVIVYFFIERTNIDVDNIAKLIIDGIESIAISNDLNVSQVVLRKTDQTLHKLDDPPETVAGLLGEEASFVYVAVRAAPNHRVIPL
jgi:Holliday junction resolvase RusA-like endonuclease